jgi:ABC-type nitrate/sulfonate/bicarbonate transport system substrate-binding protein
VEALRSGAIDFGADVKPGMIFEANSKGEPLYILGAMINGLPSTLISTPDVKTIADLKGKKIGCKEEGGSREVPWIRMLLRKEGIDPDREVEWVTHAGFGSLEIQKPRLERGDYQAIGLTGHYKRPEIFDLVRAAGFNVLAECTETHPYGLPSRVIATRGDILCKYPGEVVKVLKGVIRGYRFARDKKNVERIRHMYLSYDWGKDGFGWGKFDETLLDGQIASAQYLPPDGGVVERGLKDIAEEYIAWGKLPRNFLYEQATRFDFVKQAAKEVDAAYGAPEGY